MCSLSSIPRLWLLIAGIVFAAALLLYTGVWLYYAGWSAPVYIGLEWKAELTPYITIKSVTPGSPADDAGLRVNDRILRVNGFPQHVLTVAPAIARGKAGDVVTARVQRPGLPSRSTFP